MDLWVFDLEPNDYSAEGNESKGPGNKDDDNVTIFPDAGEKSLPGRYAGLFYRMIAAVIDIVLVLILSIIIAVILAVLAYAIGLKSLIPTLVSVITLAIIWLYFACSESSVNMATPGKRICGLKVTDLSGMRITFAQATIRWAIIDISGIFSLLPVPLCGWMLFLFTIVDIFSMYANAKRQCIHDMIAGTVVVHESQTIQDDPDLIE